MEQGTWMDPGWKGTWDPFVRLAYQFGMLLGVDEFQGEQGYHLCKHRLGQRLFVGYGLGWGGAVSVTLDATHGTETLSVAPLFALDELGRELWLKDTCTLNLAQWATENQLTDGVPAYLTVAYQACDVAPVPAVAAPCDDAASPTMPSRALETAVLELSVDPPPAPLDLSSLPGATPGDTQASRFATLVELIRTDAARPLLLGTVTRTTDSGGKHAWTFTRDPALPRLRIAGGSDFRVLGTNVSGTTLEVRFTAPPASAPSSAFRMDLLAPPPDAPTSLVDETQQPTPSDGGKTLTVKLKAAPTAGKTYRISVLATGATPALAQTPGGLLALNDGTDFNQSWTAPNP